MNCKKITLLIIAQALLHYCIAQNALPKKSGRAIARTINVLEAGKDFPRLAAFLNTSIQKVPAPALAALVKKELGTPDITRCWLNLDEMWDYRTRKFNFNFLIGQDKYAGIPQKYRESWNWVTGSNVPYENYLGAFGSNSRYMMLTIRRYERDVLDKRLPVSKKDWKMVFKTGLKHYKIKHPNIRYIEVGNEYHLSAFMNATNEEYYQFFQLAYEAVNEINRELNLNGEQRILVGGPVVTGNDVLERIDSFLTHYSSDASKIKKIDFISWHDYSKPISVTSFREKDLSNLLIKHKLDADMPLFITEHDPYHMTEDKLEYHYLNSAYLPKALYFANLNSPRVKIFPWVLYHNKDIQTKFMWFMGPNDINTQASELQLTPLGQSMKFLSMLKGKEIRVENSIEGNDLVLAATDDCRITVEVINYEGRRNVQIVVNGLTHIAGENNSWVLVESFLIDSVHSNCLTNKNFRGGPEKVGSSLVTVRKGAITLKYPGLQKNGLVLWVIRRP